MPQKLVCKTVVNQCTASKLFFKATRVYEIDTSPIYNCKSGAMPFCDLVKHGQGS